MIHERLDGTGYPDGLVGNDIPFGARVIAVCDAFDAMTSERPYADGLSVADALLELRSCSGVEFEPAVVDALADLLIDEGLAQIAGGARMVAPVR